MSFINLKNFILKNLLSIAVLSIIYLYIIYIFNPSLIFLDTTPSGSDISSHKYIFSYLKKNLPSLHTWSHDWYYGFPFLFFYPPLLYLIALFLNIIIPDNIAFKITTVLGSLLLPLTIYILLKNTANNRLVPLFGAVLSLFFLFNEQYTIYGGNIPSTLSGEFSFSFSFAIFWLFIVYMKKGIPENRHVLLNIILLSIMVLSHPIPVIFSISIMAYFLIPYQRKHFLYILKIYSLSFILTSWWSLPFVLYFKYTSPIIWNKFLKISDIFPIFIIPWEIISIISLFYGFFVRDENIKFFGFILITSFLIYLLIDQSKIWNTRFLPFFHMSSIILSAYFFKLFLSKIKDEAIFIILFSLSSVCFINNYAKIIPYWINWIYEGFENKESWKEINFLYNYIKRLSFGRVMWEYTPEYNKFGTPRVLELIPLFSEKPTVEGLLIESSFSAPFHFILQAETTLTPTMPNFGFQYPQFNFKKAVEHMKYLGIKYFIAYTNNVKNEANKYLTISHNLGNFTIYEIPNVRLIEPIFNFEIKKKSVNWKDKAIEWFINGDLSKPLIFTDQSFFLKNDNNFNFKKLAYKNFKCDLLKITNSEIIFYTEGIGIPHLVKVSYFPKWKVDGAKGPFLASPSFIVVIPESNYVKLKFD